MRLLLVRASAVSALRQLARVQSSSAGVAPVERTQRQFFHSWPAHDGPSTGSFSLLLPACWEAIVIEARSCYNWLDLTDPVGSQRPPGRPHLFSIATLKSAFFSPVQRSTSPPILLCPSNSTSAFGRKVDRSRKIEYLR